MVAARLLVNSMLGLLAALAVILPFLFNKAQLNPAVQRAHKVVEQTQERAKAYVDIESADLKPTELTLAVENPPGSQQTLLVTHPDAPDTLSPSTLSEPVHIRGPSVLPRLPESVGLESLPASVPRSDPAGDLKRISQGITAQGKFSLDDARKFREALDAFNRERLEALSQ